MSRTVICTVFLSLVLVPIQSTVWAQENQIVNGEFDDDTNGWGRYGTTGFGWGVVQDARLSGANAAVIDVTDASATASIGIAQGGLLLEPGKTYPIGFTARAEQNREMVVLLQTNLDNTSWPTQVEQRVDLTPVAETYVIEYTHSGDTLGDDATEGVNLYLMLKGTWWPMAGEDLNAKVWIDRVYFGAEPPLPRRDLAVDPDPVDGATDVWRDADLGWTPGAFAQTHDIYLGTAFDDVNNASRTSPMDVLVSQGQTGTTYDPGRLEFGQTYYWRIDEVNAAPDNTIFKGAVWSFTAEPFAYPVENVIATSNGTSEAAAGAENTVNGSGLNANDQHSTTSTDMWLATPSGADPISIQFEFDRVYKLHEMLVWNYNVQFELLLGFGIKNVAVEYSENGTDWTVLGDVELAQGTTRADYAANTAIDLAGAAARYVRLTVNSGFGVMGQYGLSEVRFMYIPIHPQEPRPADGATDVAVDAMLGWRAGREAAVHEIYLSTDGEAVADGTALVDTVETASYAPADLEFGSMYYWKVNEVNDAEAISLWEGDVWSFVTQEYAAIEDFESYTDDLDAGEAIFQSWIDGWENDTGSTVGYLDAPFAEQTIVNSGGQSMPLAYDNSVAPFYSETERDLGSQDWSRNGADTLVVNFRGRAPEFFETEDGRILMNSIGADVWGTADQFRYVHKQLNGDGSIVARIDYVMNTWAWARAGVMIREGLDAGSAHATVAVTPGNGVSLSHRPIMNQASFQVNQPDLVAPYWVKLTRSGNIFTAQQSEDGVNWVSITDDAAASTIEIDMDANVYIGLMSVSARADIVGAATFSNITTTGNVTGAWETSGIGVEQPVGNTPAALYVAVEDNAGNVQVVNHPDALATAAADWQAWQIPFSALSGVNLRSVKMIYIGVGDRDNPTAGGTGLLYIDDIGFGRPYTGPADVTAPGDAVQGVPNDGDWPSAETPDLVIDDDVNTKFLHFKGDFEPDAGPSGLRVTPAVGATVVTALTFTTANDVAGRDPIAFELYGSKDSIDGPYTLIAGGDIADFAQAAEWPRFTKTETAISFENLVSYSHYQLLFTAIRGPVGGSVNSMQIAEVELIGVAAP